MRIGELARRTGVSERLLRYYEEQGLLQPRRRPSGYREYEDADVETVIRIRTLLAAGLNTALIAQILPCFLDNGEYLVPTCAEMVNDLHRAREQITVTIDELLRSRTALDEVIAAAPPQDAEPAVSSTPPRDE
ncbi:MerR family transcriptional regulator [Halostreptopolyspora alba]|uniref:MerR family transcriptional regulator n=1 Tax=Halostreptopolyspora alba TaxID=2487137 RepID=A0A3N0EFP2_9ACTN|nr:MerR family transcriptional regulator [Nocardiopsaceae bacterium YIM 96095]